MIQRIPAAHLQRECLRILPVERKMGKRPLDRIPKHHGRGGTAAHKIVHVLPEEMPPDDGKAFKPGRGPHPRQGVHDPVGPPDPPQETVHRNAARLPNMDEDKGLGAK